MDGCSDIKLLCIYWWNPECNQSQFGYLWGPTNTDGHHAGSTVIIDVHEQGTETLLPQGR